MVLYVGRMDEKQEGPQGEEEWRAHAMALQAQVDALNEALSTSVNEERADQYLASGTMNRLAEEGANKHSLRIVIGAMARMGKGARWSVVREFQKRHFPDL